jgi:phosphonate transport system substrate-binding protein
MSRFLLAALIAWLATAPAVAQEAPSYRFSPVNQYDIKLTSRLLESDHPLRFGKERRSLQLKIGRTSADTTSYVLAQEVEFVFSNHLFSPDREKFGWRVFGRRQMPPVHAQIAVPEDSPITNT